MAKYDVTNQEWDGPAESENPRVAKCEEKAVYVGADTTTPDGKIGQIVAIGDETADEWLTMSDPTHLISLDEVK